MSGYPAYIGSTPEDIFVANIEDVLCGKVCTKQIATCGVDDTLRLSGGARCIKNEEWVFAVEFCSVVVRACALHCFVPPHVASFGHRNTLFCAFQDQYFLDGGTSTR